MTDTRFKSVWDALEDTPADALNMKARADIMMAIKGEIDKWGISNTKAATRLAVTEPRLDDLIHGRVDRFDLEALTNLARAAGLEVAWHITPRAA
jgi:predicted XRE-type DNA-binding protein